MIRSQVLTLYREILKTIKQIENPQHREELKIWAREEFKQNKSEKNEVSF